MNQGPSVVDVPDFLDVPTPLPTRAALTASDEPNPIAIAVAESALAPTKAEKAETKETEETETASPPVIEQLKESQAELTQLYQAQATTTPPLILSTAGAQEFLAWRNYSPGKKPSLQQVEEAFKVRTIPRL